VDALEREAQTARQVEQDERRSRMDAQRQLLLGMQMERLEQQMALEPENLELRRRHLALREQLAEYAGYDSETRRMTAETNRLNATRGRGGGGSAGAIPRPEGVDEATWNALPRKEKIRLAREGASAGAARRLVESRRLARSGQLLRQVAGAVIAAVGVLVFLGRA
jgi:hypothetical protein